MKAKSEIRIVFMGTPEFAVPSLERLISDGYTLAEVVTQPDKPKDRGMKMTPAPVKAAASAHGLPVYQPKTLRGGEAWEHLRDAAPDLIVVAAYGKILPREILDLPKFGCVNVHASLLPRWRGAAPINWAVLNGDTQTGVTIMSMAEGLDSGDIIAQRSAPIGAEESVAELCERLSLLGAELLSDSLQAVFDGTATRTPQEDALSCYAPMLSRELSPIDFQKSPDEICNQVRGLLPWPAATAGFFGITFKIFSAEKTEMRSDRPPGTLLGADKRGINVVCGGGEVLRILELQPPGKKRMKAADYLRGHPQF